MLLASANTWPLAVFEVYRKIVFFATNEKSESYIKKSPFKKTSGLSKSKLLLLGWLNH
jgi:hypothetical protein